MKILYIDKHHNHMIMESESDNKLVLPVVVKYYSLLDTTSVIIDPDLQVMRTIKRNMRKRKEKMMYVFGQFTYNGGGITNSNNWQMELFDKMPPDMQVWYNMHIKEYIDAFIRTYCTPQFTELSDELTNLGYKYYFEDFTIANAVNCTINLYGRGHIYTAELSNVLINIYGEYDID
jgi:hypothetical protein